MYTNLHYVNCIYIYTYIYIDPYIPSKAAKYGGSPPADPGPGPAAGPLHRGRELSEPEAVASSTHHFQMVDVYLYIYIYKYNTIVHIYSIYII